MGGSWQSLVDTALLLRLRKAHLMLYFATCAPDGQPMPCRQPLFLINPAGDAHVFSAPTKLLDGTRSPPYISINVNIGILNLISPPISGLDLRDEWIQEKPSARRGVRASTSIEHQ